MSRFREFDFTREAGEFLRESLQNGGALSKFVLERVELECGRILSFLPEDVEQEYATRFRYGFWMYASEPADWVVDTSLRFLKEGANRAIVFEPWPPRAKLSKGFATLPPMHTFGKDMYLPLLGATESPEILRWTIAIAEPTVGVVAFLTRVSESFTGKGSSQEIEEAELVKWAEQTEKIILAAYDGEGYVVWHRGAIECGG